MLTGVLFSTFQGSLLHPFSAIQEALKQFHQKFVSQCTNSLKKVSQQFGNVTIIQD